MQSYLNCAILYSVVFSHFATELLTDADRVNPEDEPTLRKRIEQEYIEQEISEEERRKILDVLDGKRSEE